MNVAAKMIFEIKSNENVKHMPQNDDVASIKWLYTETILFTVCNTYIYLPYNTFRSREYVIM